LNACSVACGYTEKLENMKTKTQKKSVLNLNMVREPKAIDQMFQRNTLGYLTTGEQGQLISVDDAVGYVVTKLESGQSAMREAILFTGWIYKNKPEAESKAFGESLKSRWNGSTLPNMISIAKALGTFEEKGLAVDKVRDLYGLREVSKFIKSDDGFKAIKLLNDGMSPRALKKEMSPDPTRGNSGGNTTPDAAADPVNLIGEKDKFGQLLLGYADKFAMLAENEDRLKMARQLVAKLNLGGYMLLHTDAAKAVESLKAKK